MVKVKSISKSKIKIVAVVAVVIIAVVITLGYANLLKTSVRPSYCDNKGSCIPQGVYDNLPEYPKDFNEIDIMVENSLLPIVENFTEGVPDENYFLQPEFYPTWETQGITYYTSLGTPGYTYNYVGVAGYGSNPGSIVIRSQPGAPVRPGSDLLAVTYFYTSWGVRNYQGMGLGIVYPDSALTEAGQFQVVQNPEVVKNYFVVRTEPDVILLEPNFPVFKEGWAHKVRVFIHINDDTPPGQYVIGINPIAPPVDKDQEWFKLYRLRYYTLGGTIATERPTYQIFIQVE